MRPWRVAHKQFADLSGTGGLHRPGRWHSVGRPIVYAAEHSALAMLEVRVHLDFSSRFLEKFVMIRLRVEDDLPIVSIETEPEDEAVSRQSGDSWLAEAKTCLCRVKSALAPDAFNYLINPLHPDIAKVNIEAIAPLEFDARLFR